MNKRIFSFLMVLCIICTCFPLPAFAENPNGTGETDGLNDTVSKYAQDVDDSLAAPVDETDAQGDMQTALPDDLQATPQVNVLASPGEVNRYSVLVLDVSPSMSTAAMSQMKEAARRFTAQVLAANGNNYVAVISYSQNSKLICDFSDDATVITNAINRVDSITRNGTNTYAGLLEAQKIFTSGNLPSGAIKNILLMSDGMANMQYSTEDGPYTMEDCDYYESSDYSYRYANSVYHLAQDVKKISTIYTLGLFQDFTSFFPANLRPFAARCLIDIASSQDHYYEVEKAEDLEFVFGEIAEDILKKVGKFKYAGQLVQSHDAEATYYYDDAYFLNDAKNYNAQLATMSLCLELTSWSSYDTENWPDKSKNARELLTGENGIGFKEFDQNDSWNNAPTRDSIGLVAANKKIVDATNQDKEYTLIALAVRGGGYGQEWASNFTIGADGAHAGFAAARDDTLAFLKQYIAKYQITGDVKLWVVGYSRAGATANMVGGYLDDNTGYLPNVALAHKDLFVYTFEAPQGALESATTGSGRDYSNIHNIVNLNDPVPLVAPYAWDFVRYNAKDILLPSAAVSSAFPSQIAAMLTEYYKLEGATNEGYQVQEWSTQQNLRIDVNKWLPGGDPLLWFEESKVSQNDVLVSTVELLANDVFVSRLNYYTNLQDGMREIFGVLNDGSGKMEAFIEKFLNKIDLWTLFRFLSLEILFNKHTSYEDWVTEIVRKVRTFVETNAPVIADEVGIEINDLFIHSLTQV